MCVGFTAVCVVEVGLVLVLFRVVLVDPEGACLAPAFFDYRSVWYRGSPAQGFWITVDAIYVR